MPETVEYYNPQFASGKNRKRAFTAWALGFSFVLFWVGLILLAPIAQADGWTNISHPIYKFFSFLCHQMSDRSPHILENQFAVCSRCFGVYFGLVLGFIVYPFIRKIEEVEPFPRVWLFLSLIPIGVDWSLGIFGIWENTHVSRFLTGLILGTACSIFIIPALIELAQILSLKRTKALLSLNS